MIAGSRQVRHFTASSPGDHRSDLDFVVGLEFTVTGDEGAIANHEVTFARQPEFSEQRVHSAATDDLDLATWIAEQNLHVSACAKM